MSTPQPLRILMSASTRDRIGDAISQALDGRPFEAVIAAQAHGNEPADVDVAFISRDVTGLSTKHRVLEPLEAFYVTLRRSPKLAWVHVHSAGADRPIFGELKARGVRVTTSSGANAQVVAQTALAAILSLAREFPRLFDAQRARTWTPLIGGLLPRDLAGQTAVIVGWGPIGQTLAGYLRMLGLNVIAVRSAATPSADGVETYAFEDLARIAGRADWLVLACPLSDRTRGLVDARVLAAMAPHARLVNVARGEIVAEADLIEALRAKTLAGAYLDVFEHEPLDAESPLWTLPNAFVTPHSAGHSDGNEARVDRIFLDYLRQWRQ
ncbi:hydroxyacid dehydrogenase [Achromobacter xylosoxidans]|uniref:D-2-hydroxyacid dehydrogenase n=1 Tax=Achromobacter mucicolens TaxID=1389922 RepID=UPI000792A48F|nr:D-2-hydroxyacid dehydrogenase [Achromobacter mucicolens]KXJ63887.1 hydroxyacid dehydrogenase [Achromobacter xylosoxidans]UAN00917.1 D-2-hydroxyacid dehydrogenase [Achromobacter mucicolens]